MNDPAVCYFASLATTSLMADLISDHLLHFLVERPLSVRQLLIALTALMQV